jgi:aquaporin-4
MILVVVGCGTCMGGKDEWEKNEPTILQISMAFGLVVATVVWCLAHISGGHVNPAVTIAFLVTRKISLVRGLLYVFAQCVGALAGAGLLYGMTPAPLRGNMGMTHVSTGLDVVKGFGVEFFITFVLVFTVFSSVDEKRTDLNGSTPLTIGFAVTVCHVFAIKYTGSSMNPARTFGPAVITGLWNDHWIYWCGPVLGGIVAGMLYELLFASNASVAKARDYLLSSRYESNEYTQPSPTGESQGQGGGVPLSQTTESRLEHKASLLKLGDNDDADAAV